MASYEPSVRCFEAPGVGPISEDCYQILDSMPARKNRQTFGHMGAPGVTVGLPYDIYSGTWNNTSPEYWPQLFVEDISSVGVQTS